MHSRFASSASQALRISPSEWRYALIVRRSGLFDRAYYLEQHPGIRRFWRKFPELHYVISGESAGHAPNAAFNPTDYLLLNPDVAKKSDAALLHFIRHGRVEERETHLAGPTNRYFDGSVEPVPHWPCRSMFAIVVHVFYPEIWQNIADRLAALELEFDLIVTMPQKPEFDALDQTISASDTLGAHVVRVPNIGRDVFPFAHLAHSGLLSRYQAVCKLHTKKSPHLANGDVWRDRLIDGVLPHSTTKEMLDIFLSDTDTSLLVADQFYFRGDDQWGRNKPTAQALLTRAGHDISRTELHFPAGSMYWCKPDVLEALNEVFLTPSCFQSETGQLDATTAHAVERIMGFLVDRLGKQVCTRSQLLAKHGISEGPTYTKNEKTYQLQRRKKRIHFGS